MAESTTFNESATMFSQSSTDKVDDTMTTTTSNNEENVTVVGNELDETGNLTFSILSASQNETKRKSEQFFLNLHFPFPLKT